MFIAAVLTTAKTNSERNEPKCPLTEEWINKMWCIYMSRECYSALKGKGILAHATMWMELEDNYAEWNKLVTQGQALRDSSSWGAHRDRKENGCEGAGEEGTGGHHFLGAEFQFGRMGDSQRWMAMTVVQQYGWTGCCSTSHLKMVKMMNFMFCYIFSQ